MWTLSLSGESVELLRDEVIRAADSFRSWERLTSTASSDEDEVESVEWVPALWRRVNRNLRRLMVAGARRPEHETFTLEDLARAMDESVDSVNSWKRILGRPLSRLNIPNDALFMAEWIDGCNHYRMPRAVRAAVLELEG